MEKKKSILDSKKFKSNELIPNVIGGLPHGWTPAKNQWITRTNVHHGATGSPEMPGSSADVKYNYDVFGDIALDS